MNEGDKCIFDDCDGTLEYEEVEECLCHVAPPCHYCVNNPLICNVCSASEEEIEVWGKVKAVKDE